MNTSRIILGAFVLTLLALASFAGGYLLRLSQERPETVTIVDTLVFRDTIIKTRTVNVVRVDTVRLPLAKNDNTTSKEDTLTTPAAPSPDSATVAIPIVQRTFEGQYYRAVVQGYEPELVGIDIKLPRVPAPARQPRKWWSVTIGPQVGYGFTPKGWQPYAGIGVTAGISF